MSIFDSEQYLAGVSTEIVSERQSSYDQTLWDTTDSVVVIGTAFNGPTGVIVPVWNPQHAKYVFGGSYNSVTKKEVDLVAGIQEAWDKGCRTIFGLRVGGKDIVKDFALSTTSRYKLRVKSMYPTNTGKQAYFNYDDTEGEEILSFYKIPARATINERTGGMVDSLRQMLRNNIRINQDYGFTKDSPLVDVLKLFNNHTFNNVLRLAIVDNDGVDVTEDKSVYDIPVAALFPGTYFIGREKNHAKMPVKTNVKTEFIFNESGSQPKMSLVVNTDVSAPYPIYGTNHALREALVKVGIQMIERNDYLGIMGATSRAFIEDSVDYEEVDLTDFEKYQKLGKGFAITAKLEKRVDSHGNELLPKVVETKSIDPYRIIGIEEGLYSMLQDAPIDYRVMGSAFGADKVVGGKLPKPKDFLVSTPQSITYIANGDPSSIDVPYLLQINALHTNINAPVKKYKFMMNEIDKNQPAISKDTLYTDNVIQMYPIVKTAADIDFSVSNGTKVLVGDKTEAILYTVADGKATKEPAAGYDDGTKHTYAAVTIIEDTITGGVITATSIEHVVFVSEKDGATDMKFKPVTVKRGAASDPATPGELSLKGHDYMAININQDLYIWKVDATDKITPMADFQTLQKTDWANAETVFTYIENLPMGYNLVRISSPYFDSVTLADFVTELNESDMFNDLFKVELTNQGVTVKDEYLMGDGHNAGIADNVINKKDALTAVVTDFGADHAVGYDYTLYVPYRTTDNFARQLAQHCTYTELKTARTHGVIGMQRQIDVSLSAVAKKVKHILDFNFDLYAKKNNGRDLLDSDNLPVNIGRNISIVNFEERVQTDDNTYSFLSNGAAAYAGMISQLPVTRSSTMYQMNISPLFDLTHSQIQSLTDRGIVTVRNTYTRGYCVTDGTTAADPTDIMSRLNVVRIAGAVESVIRAACEPFIGLQNTVANRNSLQTAIESGFKTLSENGLINSYKFDIIDNTTVAYYTTVEIQYEIVPVGEIRRVKNIITVRANAT